MYRYIGNKTRLTAWLLEEIATLASSGATVADPMCGTASVSCALRQSGYRVLASDLMTYAAHHARVRLLLNAPPLFADLGLGGYEETLQHLNSLPSISGLFFREYGPEGSPANGGASRLYLSAENAGKLDAINAAVNTWRRSGRLSILEHSLLRH